MDDYQRILLAVDYSVQGDRVAEKAKALAEKHQA
jgi:hypothetical protein